MRCYCCDNLLTPQQATRKFKESEEYTDMCDKCLNEIVDYDLDTVDGEACDEDLFDANGDPVEDT